MRVSVKALVGTAILAVSAVISTPALAQSSAGDADLLQQIEEMRAREAVSQARIETLEKRLHALETALGLSVDASTLLSEDAEASIRGRGAPSMVTARRFGDTVTIQSDDSGGGTALAASVQAGADVEQDRKEPAPSEAVEAVARSEQGYFGDRFSFEAGFTYTHFDEAQLNLSGFLALDAIFLGLISLDEITSDVFLTDFTARYGITDRIQIDVNVPWLYRHSNFQSGGAGGSAATLTETDVHDSGLGDISMGVSYRLLRETIRRPDIVLNARVKAPTGRHPFGTELVVIEGSEGNLQVPESLSTGSGVWGASAGISLLKTLDPMVIFGSLTYFHNFKRHFDDLDEAPNDQPGSANIGDAIQYGLGVAYALNERSSLSMSFTQRVAERTRLRRDSTGLWRSVIGSQANVGIVNLGATFALTNRIALLTTLGIGMTRDAPDMTFSVRLPFSF